MESDLTRSLALFAKQLDAKALGFNTFSLRQFKACWLNGLGMRLQPAFMSVRIRHTSPFWTVSNCGQCAGVKSQITRFDPEAVRHFIKMRLTNTSLWYIVYVNNK